VDRRNFLKAVPSLAVLVVTGRSLAQDTVPASRSLDSASPPAPLPFVDGSFTLVVLPDIQNYAEAFPALLDEQTRWIAAQRADRHIAFVITLGDLTNRNTSDQWENVRRAFRRLDGIVPYVLVAGNHDYGHDGSTDSRETGLNTAFRVQELTQRPTFGGLFEPGRLDNSYHFFTAGGRDWLVLALEFGPRDAVLAWAAAILDKYPNRRVIVVTHAYLYSDNTRYDHVLRPEHRWDPHSYPSAKLPGGTNDGEEIWRKLVAPHDNVDFVLCGHVLNSGTGRLSSANPHGHVVHQILANYQERPHGGDGYLRLMEFLPDGVAVQVKTYSPVLDQYLTDPTQQFVLELTQSRRRAASDRRPAIQSAGCAAP
jgi:3',5'-cyclic AMP phosphodiesterase CpdA